MASDDRVTLVNSEHAKWAQMARKMAAQISEFLPLAKIEHIGSTAVPGMPAKAVVDIAVGMPADQIGDAALMLTQHGFDIEGRRQDHAWLSYPDRSSRSFVIHVFEVHGAEWRKRLRFRDILISDASSRERYLAAKQAAAAASKGWGDYTRMKSSVVSEILDADYSS